MWARAFTTNALQTGRDAAGRQNQSLVRAAPTASGASPKTCRSESADLGCPCDTTVVEALAFGEISISGSSERVDSDYLSASPAGSRPSTGHSVYISSLAARYTSVFSGFPHRHTGTQPVCLVFETSSFYPALPRPPMYKPGGPCGIQFYRAQQTTTGTAAQCNKTSSNPRARPSLPSTYRLHHPYPAHLARLSGRCGESRALQHAQAIYIAVPSASGRKATGRSLALSRIASAAEEMSRSGYRIYLSA
ncbi:hypothetical protein MIND_00406500 [Mycena indigotica]|uniref:Uncharacterized protein n=1 Tax=Mycena indigotica TaxID=2126181 RepID=A0A8H6T3P8_9AGAR|nr:uncharacterized protein MIND_00406500 [Mycena indigotica]KAF7310324.1 hypothetical protein MIND_00406500 [Mycena indigotica]